jgi:phenylpropionate dioxygenase-like ring-hydroxylating dioxygenase large terminal subunit
VPVPPIDVATTTNDSQAQANSSVGAPLLERDVLIPRPEPSRDLRRSAIHPDHWYPVARSRRIKPGAAFGVSFAGEPIVLVRTKAGALYALEDRCAHRQVPLSLGVVKGDYLQCGYHCWSYDRDGRCVGAPYVKNRSELPDGVRAYPCREEYGFVFVFPGRRELAESTPFPDVPSASDRHYKTRYLDRKIACHWSFMHENLMDMNHQFLHRRLMGGIKTTCLDVREDETGVEVDYTFSRVKGKQPFGERFIIGRSGTQARDVDLMTIRTEYPYQWLRFWTKNGTEPALELWNCYTPTDREQRANHTFGMINVRKPGIPGLIHAIWPIISWFTDSIFREDRDIVELEQKAFDEQGADWNQEVFPAIRTLRAMLVRRSVDLTPGPTPSGPGACGGGKTHRHHETAS